LQDWWKKRRADPSMSSLDVIIVAAGSGTRLGMSVPKAFVPLMGKPILSYSLRTFLSHQAVNSVILVVPDSMYESATRDYASNRVKITTGGEHRWQSVCNGVNLSDAEWVMIHDAARPFVNDVVIDRLLALKPKFDCAITVTPEVDTIRMYSGDLAGVTVDREKLVRVGTPQMFRKETLCQGLIKAQTLPTPPTDEAILMQQMGVKVGIAWGDSRNFKITTPSDLEIAEALIARSQQMSLGGK
jgi:2-C-methyl-D-erythritol 4-phosphate cytidylyltransferase